jgi:uncharacterized protein (TIGR02284 family)
MATQARESQAIKDLIVINNDRYEGYKTAAAETKDGELKGLFNTYSEQSRGFAEALRKFVLSDEQPDRDETKASGKLYRVWMDVKHAVSTNDRKAVLSSCEFGEDAAKKEYESALKNTENMSPEALELVGKQSQELRQAHDKIKMMRDSSK